MHPVKLAAYLARIGIADRPAADAAGLARVQRAHRRAIPFENLDIPLGRGISLDPDIVFDKLVRRRRGGYCFEQNGLFLAALHALGFTARLLLGRVWLFADGVPAKTHVIALVTIDGEDWIADAGFGGTDLPPMPLVEGELITPDGTRHRLRRDTEHGWMLERNGQPQYSFTEARVWPADLALANHWVSTAPASRFVQMRIANIVTAAGLDSLDDADARDAAAYRSALSDRFGILLDEADVAALVAPAA